MRSSLTLAALFAAIVAVLPIPSENYPAVASEGTNLSSGVVPTVAEPLTVCDESGCQIVTSQPTRSIVTRTVSYSAPVRTYTRTVYQTSYGTRGSYGVRATGKVFNRSAPFMKRGPVRRILSFPFGRRC